MKSKILITGGAGFIGSNFARKFLKNGEEVHLIVRPKSDLWRIDSVKDLLNLHLIDLTDANQVEKFIYELQPQIILHFAAHPGYTGKDEDVKPTINTNMLGTVNLINACSKIFFRCFINTGSSSEYGVKDIPIKESDIPEPNNLYGVTKLAGTLYGQFMAKKFDLPIIAMRLFSPYGYYDRARLIPAVINGFLRNVEYINLNSPTSMRDYIFIEDIIDVYMRAIENVEMAKGEVFNIASGRQYSAADVVALIREITHSSVQIRYGIMKAKQYEPANWIADISKAQKIFKWEPCVSLIEGLEKTIIWFKKHMNFYEGYF